MNVAAGTQALYSKVSSARSGYAMKGKDRNRLTGAVVGKAMEPFASGSGVIQVLVTLQ